MDKFKRKSIITFDLDVQIKLQLHILIVNKILRRQDFIEKKWRKTCFLGIFFFVNKKNFLLCRKKKKNGKGVKF